MLRPSRSTVSSLSSAFVLVSALALTGCPKDSPPGAADAAADAPAPTAPASGAASAPSGASSPGAKPSGAAGAANASGAAAKDGGAAKAGKVLTGDERKALLAALNEGRRRSRAKDFAAALAEFDKALAIAPDDARVLAEVGWAALQANDLARAEKANKRALAHVRDKSLRAQILYNEGRVAEAKKDGEAARKAYAESLALRDNAEVRRRLESAGGTPPPSVPCANGGPTPEAVCSCLLGRKDDLMVLFDAKPTCAPTAASLTLGTPRLSVLRWGAPDDGMGERVYLLAARDGATMRPVAELGVDYEPGAFGIHNEAKITGGEARTIGKRSVVVVKSHQGNLDTNMAGLEACTHDEDRETVCAMGEGERPTRCVTVPVLTESGCGPGAEPDDLDDETKTMLAEMKKSWGKTTTRLGWSLDDDGTLVVRSAEGAKSVVTKHKLF